MKDTENRARTITVVKKTDENDGASPGQVPGSILIPLAAGLPRAASWAAKGHNNAASATLTNSTNANQIPAPSSRQTRRTAPSTRQQRSGSTVTSSSTVVAPGRERKSTRVPSLASSSRPTTPAIGTASSIPPVPSTRPAKQKDSAASLPDTSRPATPAGLESDAASVAHDSSPPLAPSAPLSPEPVAAASPAVPPGLPALPPGLPAPPGLLGPSRTPVSTDSSPQIPSQTSQGPYQISTQAQALVEDIKARREATSQSTGPSPFPDFDRMLQLLAASDGSFSFNLDPELAGDGDDEDATLGLPDFGADPNVPFSGSFMDAFPRLRQAPPPGLGFPPQLEHSPFPASRTPVLERPPTASSYTGSFNPFAPESSDESPRQYSPLDEERKVSRFTFARGRQGSASASVSSPLHASSSLSLSESSSQAAYYSPPEVLSPTGHASPQWGYASRNPNHEYLHQSHSSMSSPLAQYAQAQPQYTQQQPQSRFQPFDSTVSEAQLRDFINSSRTQAGALRPPSGMSIVHLR